MSVTVNTNVDLGVYVGLWRSILVLKDVFLTIWGENPFLVNAMCTFSSLNSRAQLTS